jgi:predicted Zn-dependent protease
MIWRNTDSLFAYIERQPAFGWNVSQQAYIYQLWAAEAQAGGRIETAREKIEQARQAQQRGLLAAMENEDWAEAIERSRQLEQTFGLPPVLRRERARWLLNLGRLSEAGAELRQTRREIPDDAATEALILEWEKRAGRSL